METYPQWSKQNLNKDHETLLDKEENGKQYYEMKCIIQQKQKKIVLWKYYQHYYQK